MAKGSVGHISYTKNVVRSIVTLATEEVEGVCTFRSNTGKKRNSGKNVTVDFTKDGVIVDVYVRIRYGYRVPEIAYKIQESIRRGVETMTEYKVSAVNVYVQSVSFDAAAV